MPNAPMRLAELIPQMQACWASGKTVEFTTHGTSMRPMLGDGVDQVRLSPLPEKLQKYDLPLYRRDNGQFVLHRIVEVGETFTCIGDNQFELERGVRQDQMLAVVTGFIRKGKYHDVKGLQYRLYCRFWHWTRPFRGFLLGCHNGIARRLKKICKK